MTRQKGEKAKRHLNDYGRTELKAGMRECFLGFVAPKKDGSMGECIKWRAGFAWQRGMFLLLQR